MFKSEYYQYYIIESNYGNPNLPNLCFLIHLHGDFLLGPIPKHLPTRPPSCRTQKFLCPAVPQANLFLLVDGPFYSSTHILLCSEIRAVMLIYSQNGETVSFGKGIMQCTVISDWFITNRSISNAAQSPDRPTEGLKSI